MRPRTQVKPDIQVGPGTKLKLRVQVGSGTQVGTKVQIIQPFNFAISCCNSKMLLFATILLESQLTTNILKSLKKHYKPIWFHYILLLLT